jgi:hypothetical protein
MSDEQPRSGEPWAKTSSGDADHITLDDDDDTRPPDETALAERARASRAETEALQRQARGDEEDGDGDVS